MSGIRWGGGLVLGVLAVGCAPEPQDVPPGAMLPGAKSMALDLEALTGATGWRTENLFSLGAIAWADIDGDGRLDLALGPGAPFDGLDDWDRVVGSEVEIGASEGRGFTSVHLSERRADNRGLAWADFDLDGDPDLAIGQSKFLDPEVYDVVSAPISILWNDVGGFSEADLENQNQAHTTTSLAAWDMDGDGDPDLAEGHLEGLVLWRNDGQGNLDPESALPGTRVDDVAWADLDGDGLPELGLATPDGLLVLDNEGGELLDDEAWLLVEGVEVRRLAWGDWLGDGQMHPAVVTPDDVRAYRRTGKTAQNRLQHAHVNDVPLCLAWADFDVDGLLDLAIGWEEGAVEVLGSFDDFTGRVFEEDWEDGDGLDAVLSLAPADWDGDGDPDLAVGRGDSTGLGEVDARVSGVYEALQGAATWNDLGFASGLQAADLADVDSDGLPDLTVAYSVRDPDYLYHSAIGVVRITHGDVALFETFPSFEFPTASGGVDGILVQDLAWIALEEQGEPELLAATSIGLTRFALDGETLTPTWYEPGGQSAGAVLPADFDADGDVDLAVAGLAGVRLYENRDGKLEQIWDDDSGARALMVWAAPAGDGRLVLVAVPFTGVGLDMASPDDDGGWAWTPLDTELEVAGLAAGDLDLDGADELVASRYREGGYQAELLVLDLVDGRLETSSRASFGGGYGIRLEFVDQDDHLDIVTTSGWENLHREGAWIPSRYLGRNSVAVDLDGDGDLDSLAVDGDSWSTAHNGRGGSDLLPDNPPRIALDWSDDLPATNPLAQSAPPRYGDGPVGLTLRLFDAESDPVQGVGFQFLDGAGGWRDASVTGAEGVLATAPLEDGGVQVGLSWDWEADRADGDRVYMRAILDRHSPFQSVETAGRIATTTRPRRLLLDRDGDGLREISDPCPDDPTNDSLIEGYCDSYVLSQGRWCGVVGAPRSAIALAWVAVAVAGRRRGKRR